MTELSTAPSSAAPAHASRDALDRLTPLGWRGGLIAIVVGLALSFFLFGYAVIYWRNADMDFMVIYSALAMNDGRPQQFLDHTAYLTILTVKSWFQLLHGLGLLDAWTLSAFPPPTEPAAFDTAMTHAVRAGRLLAFLIAIGSVLIFAALGRRILRDWRVTLLATLAFALSGGIAVHSRILRSELVAALPVIFALMILIATGRRASLFRPLFVAASAFLCVLGLENKVQAILLIAVLPFVVLPFGGKEGRSVRFWQNTSGSWLVVAAAVLLALAAGSAAWPLARVGFDRALLDAAQFHPLLLGRFGVYQIALLALVAACMVAYAAIWRIAAAETLAAIAGAAAAGAAALLVLDIDYNTANVIAVFNPLEKMLTFADTSTASAANGSSIAAILLLLLDGLGGVLTRYTFVLHSSPRPTVFLTWLVIPGIVYAWRRGERQAALQALMLMLGAIGIDMLGVRRGLKSEYFIFTDPLIILAGAILLDSLDASRFHKWAYSIAITLFALHIAIGQAEPIKYALKRSGPESICEWNSYYMPLMPLPWCKRAPA
ncbi:hypothetical protein [Bradyrhizobium sp. NP1]|uniref:hypothetical protein n=1 Tax=Bradyrhizobium sp. NP1 TaxID=3049772 RepID=UPI0025A4ED02|nr:hypothetical protein [Bradyrhizobium sp. NP1]WJR75260.1 hypothetical protein QOU61_20855 [Bradyrhizobium sp. NP1]